MSLSNLKTKFASAVKAFERFVESDLFILFMGWCVVFFSVCSLDLWGFLVVTILFCCIMMSNCNIRAIYPVMFTLAFTMSNKNSPIYDGAAYYLSTFMISMLAVMAFLIVFCAVFGIIKRGISVKLSIGLYGMIAFCLSYLLSGLIYSENLGANFVASSVISFIFLAPFCFFACFYKKDDFVYIAKALVMSTLVPVAQLFFHYMVNPHILGTFDKGDIVLGWGVSNAIGIMIAIGLPFSGYFLIKGRRPSLALIAMSLQLVGTVFTFSRASILVAVPIFFGLCIYSLFVRRGKDLRNILLTALIIVALVAVAIIWQWDKLKVGYDWFMSVNIDDRGREPLIAHALDRFKQEIFFGVGVFESIQSGATYIYFYHNIVVQVMAWGGLVGLLFLIIHVLLFLFKVVITKNSLEKWLAILSVVAILVDSMLDCVIYYPYLAFIYVLCILMADKWEVRGKGKLFKSKSKILG